MPRITDTEAHEAWDLLMSKYDGRLAFVPEFPGTREQVKAIFNVVALATHPDHGGTAEDFQEARRAQGALLLYQEQVAPPAPRKAGHRPCEACNGTGRTTRPSRVIGSKGLAQICRKCRGTGDADLDTHNE